MQTEQHPNNPNSNSGQGHDLIKNQTTILNSPPQATSIKSMILSAIEEDLLEQQTAYSHSDLTFSLKKDCLDDMMSLTNERDSKQEVFSDTEIGSLEYNKKTNKSSKKNKENTNESNTYFTSQTKQVNAKRQNSKKNKRELRCKTVIIQQEKKSHAHRLDFDFLVYDSLKYAENKSPLSMACYHKSMDKFELNKKDKLLSIHLDTLEKIKTPITLILKKLISDSSSSAKNLCDSLFYFHKLLKRFRMIRENNSDKINIFKQLMPILPNHQTPEQVLASDPKFPSLTATYRINAKKGTISLDKYTFNERLAHLLGFPTLEHLQQNIQFTKKFPQLSVPSDYYNYIMEALLNKFEKSRNSVSKGYLKTFDGIKVSITEKMVSRCHIDSDITPEEINILKDATQDQKCKIEEEDYEYVNKQDDDDENEDNEEDNSPQGILYVMTKHFFFIDNQELSNYIFSKERLAICESIDYSSIHEESLPNPNLTYFQYIHSKKENQKTNLKFSQGEDPRKKKNLNNNSSSSNNSKEQDKELNIKQEFATQSATINSLQSVSTEEIQKQQAEINNCLKQEDINFNNIDILSIIQQSFLLNQQLFSPQIPEQQQDSSNQNNQQQYKSMEEDTSAQSRCTFRFLNSNLIGSNKLEC